MKKSILLIVVAALSLASCSSTNNKSESTSEKVTTAVTQHTSMMTSIDNGADSSSSSGIPTEQEEKPIMIKLGCNFAWGKTVSYYFVTNYGNVYKWNSKDSDAYSSIPMKEVPNYIIKDHEPIDKIDDNTLNRIKELLNNINVSGELETEHVAMDAGYSGLIVNSDKYEDSIELFESGDCSGERKDKESQELIKIASEIFK